MTSTTHHETQIVSDPDVPLVRIVREFDAPPEKVFRAHTDPELVAQWLGPRNLTMTIDHYDCRTGGSYRYIHSRDGEDYGFHGSFHEVRPNELIVQTFTFEGMPDGVAQADRLRVDALDPDVGVLAAEVDRPGERGVGQRRQREGEERLVDGAGGCHAPLSTSRGEQIVRIATDVPSEEICTLAPIGVPMRASAQVSWGSAAGEDLVEPLVALVDPGLHAAGDERVAVGEGVHE